MCLSCFILQPYKTKLDAEQDKDKKTMYEKILNKVENAVSKATEPQAASEDVQAQVREVRFHCIMFTHTIKTHTYENINLIKIIAMTERSFK